MPKRAAESSPARKGGDDANDDKKNEKETPYDAYFARQEAVQNAQPTKILGQMLIKGIPRSDDSDYEEDSDEDEGKNNSKFTEEQMASLRFVLITQSRADKLDEMREFVLGDQAHDGILMFNTSFSYGIRDGFYDFKGRRYAKAKTFSEKFDLLFAYTYNLKEYDVWMQDNEGDMDGMVRDLAKMWKALLKKDNATLGIDPEYTRPGILELLESFKEAVEESETEPPLKFMYH